MRPTVKSASLHCVSESSLLFGYALPNILGLLDATEFLPPDS